jgi:hypothetical protein
MTHQLALPPPFNGSPPWINDNLTENASGALGKIASCVSDLCTAVGGDEPNETTIAD